MKKLSSETLADIAATQFFANRNEYECGCFNVHATLTGDFRICAYHSGFEDGVRSVDVPPGGWAPTKWWRVMRDGELWCETSFEGEARQEAREGGVPERFWTWQSALGEWRPADEEN